MSSEWFLVSGKLHYMSWELAEILWKCERIKTSLALTRCRVRKAMASPNPKEVGVALESALASPAPRRAQGHLAQVRAPTTLI